MQVDVRLVYQYGYIWFSRNGVAVKGYAWNERNELLREDSLAGLFEQTATAEDFERQLKKLNGLFSVIVQRDDLVFFATDRTRTFPLFYAERGGMLIISDAVYEAVQDHFSLQEAAAKEFLYTGYVTGSETFFTGINQVQAGEYVVAGRAVVRRFYHAYAADDKIIFPFDALTDQLTRIFDNTGKRLVAALAGRTAVLPLSGGYDSRLIACLLKKNNYDKVVCFTYGNRLDREVQVSKKVAAKLGYDWHFVSYADKNMASLISEDELDAYIPFCTNGASAIFLQDFYAVKFLKQQHLIPEDAVFVPGHTGDFISGGHLVPGLTQGNLTEAIIKRHYALRTGDKAAFHERVAKTLPDIPPAENFENWNLKERQAKFIINSNRAYEFWGYQHLMPLWDKELVLFFQNVDYKHKIGRTLYDHVLLTYFFQPFDIAIPKERYPFFLQKMTGAFRRVYRWLCRDNYNFKFTARYFSRKRDPGVRWDSTAVNINSVLAAWLVAKLKDKTEAGTDAASFEKWL